LLHLIKIKLVFLFNKFYRMKYLFIPLFFVLLFIACQQERCRICYLETTDTTGNILNKGLDAEFCEEELDKILSKVPETKGDSTTKYVCK
jgi:hypothetical protein